MKMLRFPFGERRMGMSRNEYISGTTQVGRFLDNKRCEIKMVWGCAEEGCEICREKDAEDKVARQEEKRKIKEDMQLVGVTGRYKRTG